MDIHSVFAVFCFYITLALSPVLAAQNFVVPWSTTKFGPDGPWQAVVITVGGNDSTLTLGAQHTADLAVYPGGEWESLTFTEDACKAIADSPCALGGTWDPDPIEYNSESVSYRGTINESAAGIYLESLQAVILAITINQRTVWNATLQSASTGNATYPNGKTAVPLGTLALGAENTKQFFAIDADKPNSGYNGSLFAGQLFEDGTTPSYSYGLHIGSAAFDYPGSLAFGGYNKGRVIEPITSFTDPEAIDLLDISIGVETGASPFNFTRKDRLLSTGQTSVTPNPLAPYLSLPRETCENLAKMLPISFDQTLKYYLWDTDSPNYDKIINSPAYLAFTFPPSPGAADNVVIKVPFALLNLTLDEPITDRPRQYFPCVPFDGRPVLGRAFLQAAFLGRNWGTKTSWLAQAPGPGVAHDGLRNQYTDIPQGGTLITGFPNDRFNASWASYWTVTDDKGTETVPTRPATSPNTESPNNNTSSTSSDGLSTGAKAGIGAGAGVGVLALLVILGLLWRRHKNKGKEFELTMLDSAHPSIYNGNSEDKIVYQDQGRVHQSQEHGGWAWLEMPANGTGNGSPVEIADTSYPSRR